MRLWGSEVRFDPKTSPKLILFAPFLAAFWQYFSICCLMCFSVSRFFTFFTTFGSHLGTFGGSLGTKVGGISGGKRDSVEDPVWGSIFGGFWEHLGRILDTFWWHLGGGSWLVVCSRFACFLLLVYFGFACVLLPAGRFFVLFRVFHRVPFSSLVFPCSMRSLFCALPVPMPRQVYKSRCFLLFFLLMFDVFSMWFPNR